MATVTQTGSRAQGPIVVLLMAGPLLAGGPQNGGGERAPELVFQMTAANSEGFPAQLWGAEPHLEEVTWRPPSFPGVDDSAVSVMLGVTTFPWWEEGVGIGDRGPSGSEIHSRVRSS